MLSDWGKTMDTKSFLNKFNKIVIENFDSFLTGKGFRFESCKKDDYFYKRVYRKNNQYIMIDANMDPRDYPYFWNVVLGEGATEMPEADWNNIALWQLMRPLENPSAKELSVKDSEINKLKEAVQ